MPDLSIPKKSCVASSDAAQDKAVLVAHFSPEKGPALDAIGKNVSCSQQSSKERASLDLIPDEFQSVEAEVLSARVGKNAGEWESSENKPVVSPEGSSNQNPIASDISMPNATVESVSAISDLSQAPGTSGKCKLRLDPVIQPAQVEQAEQNLGIDLHKHSLKDFGHESEENLEKYPQKDSIQYSTNECENDNGKDSVKAYNPDSGKAAHKQEETDLPEAQITNHDMQASTYDDHGRSELQTIMGQFQPGMGGLGADEIMSPRSELANAMVTSSLAHPLRKSSLDQSQLSPHQFRNSSNSDSAVSPVPKSSLPLQPSSHSVPPPRSSSLTSPSHTSPGLGLGIDSGLLSEELPDSPSSPHKLRKHAPLPLPPRPDPEPDLPFDFQRFLEQLRHRSADPVAKYLRSFLQEFGKKQWMVHEQIKIVSDFLDFIAKKMAQCDIWRTVPDAEFENACEGMEKLVMNRLYTQTFSPAIPSNRPDRSSDKNKRKPLVGAEPGRCGQHQEDIERDQVLAQKVRIYSWIKPEHLDIKSVNEKGHKFLSLAQQELLKMGNYRAPRDKVICVLNCCKVMFGFLKHAHHDQSADSFIPLLIYTLLRANPPNLVSNVQYILRFRNANKLTGEAGYYVSSLGGAIDFIERLDRTSLTISDSEFENYVEAAVSKIAEGHSQNLTHQTPRHNLHSATLGGAAASISEDLEIPPPLPRRTHRVEGNKSDSENDKSIAVAGLLRTIQRPLSTIGRIFSDDAYPGASTSQQTVHESTATKVGAASAVAAPPALAYDDRSNSEHATARQGSKEAEEARSIRQREELHVVETLCGMFPALEREVIIDVVRANEGR